MAKRTFGEATVKAGTRRLTLRLDFDSIEEIEDYFDLNIEDAFKSLQSGKVSKFSRMVSFMLTEDVELMDIALLINDYPHEFRDGVLSAFQRTFNPEGVEPEKAKPAAEKPAARKKSSAGR